MLMGVISVIMMTVPVMGFMPVRVRADFHVATAETAAAFFAHKF